MPGTLAQRRFARFHIQLPLLLKPRAPAPIKVWVGWSRDLSEGGACVELPEGLPPPTPLGVRLQTDRGVIDVEAQVIWAGAPDHAGGGIPHGLAFTHVGTTQLRALRNLIHAKGEVRLAGVRLPLEVPVTCQRKGQAGPPLHGRTGNLGRGGVLLYLPQALPPGTALEVTLHTASGPLTAEGAVVWGAQSEGQPPGEFFRHGLRFTAVSWTTTLSLGLMLVEPA
jgi:c-di-GMP-binding flagellar brake protein YcgR